MSADFKFHDQLKLLSNLHFEISIQGEDLILKPSPDTKPKVSENEQVARFVSRYLKDHVGALQKKDTKALEALQNRFSHLENATSSKEIQHVFSELIDTIKSSQPEALEISKIPKPSLNIIVELAPPPKSAEEFLHNLSMLRNYYPQVQLLPNLSIYDATKSSFEPPISPLSVIQELHEAKMKFTLSCPEKAELIQNLKSDIQWYCYEMKPIEIVSLLILTERGKIENGSLLKSTRSALEKKIPVVMNLQLFHCHSSEFEKFFADKKVYKQKDGDLLLILAKDQHLTSLGFNQDVFEEILSSQITDFHPKKNSLGKDLNEIFIKELPDRKFARSIMLQGHGLHSYQQIAGIPPNEFQETLSVLNDKNTAFLFVSTCYMAGSNREKLELPEGSVPFPIVFKGFTEEVTYGSYQDLDLIFKAQKSLLNPASPHQLSPLAKKGMEKLLSTYKVDKDGILHNWLSYELPRTQRIMPHFHVTESSSEWVPLSPRVSKEFKRHLEQTLQKKKGDPLEKPLEIYEAPSNRDGFILSSPTYPVKLFLSKENKAPALVSVGGNAHHVIQEIDAPELDFEKFILSTVNAPRQDITFDDDMIDHTGPAKKVYGIGTLHCSYQGVPTTLKNVVIKQSKDECHCFFRRNQEKNFTKISFELSPITPVPIKNMTSLPLWRISGSKEISEETAIFEIYQDLLTSTPNQKSEFYPHELSFYEELEELFWKNLPHQIRLFHSLLQPSVEIQSMSNEIIFMNSFRNELTNFIKEEKNDKKRDSVLQQAYSLAGKLGKFKEQNLIVSYSENSLILAVKTGSLQDVKAIIESDPHLVSREDAIGQTALHHAAKQENLDAITVLLKAGASLDIKNRLGEQSPLDILLVSSDNNAKIIPFLLEKNVPFTPRQLCLAFETAHYEKNQEAKDIILSKISLVELLEAAVEAKLENVVFLILEKYPFELKKFDRGENDDLIRILKNYKEPATRELIYKLIEKKKLDLVSPINAEGMNALQFAIQSLPPSQMTIIHVLINEMIKQKISLDHQDILGNTALHDAIAKNQIPAIFDLLQKGALLNIPNKKGEMAEHLLSIPLINFCKDISGMGGPARDFAIAELCERLKDSIPSPFSGINIPDEAGYRILDYAGDFNDAQLIQLLMEKGAKNLKNSDGSTPLLDLVQGCTIPRMRDRKLTLIKIILENGLLPENRENDCYNALLAAVKLKLPALVKLFIQEVNLSEEIHPAKEVTKIKNYLKENRVS